jgi:septal ring factor EnvC (AmiA/AmiB activator)
MSDTPLAQASQLETLRNQYMQIENEVSSHESEKLEIYKKLNKISERITEIQASLKDLNDDKDNVDQLITEISKGFNKIEASTQSLLLLTTRQLKMLKRKYNYL